MTVNTTWVDPSASGTLDLATDSVLTETVWDGVVSDLLHLGGSAGLLTTSNAGLVGINQTTNASMTVGLTVNQGAADNEIVSLKSSDVAHGMTTITETDTYGNFLKAVAASGGLLIRGLTTGTNGLNLAGTCTTEDATHTAAGIGIVNIVASTKNGTGDTGAGANVNLLAVRNGTNTRAIIDAEGDLHLDATSNINVWDAYDDLALLETYRALSGADFRARFARNMDEHAEVLGRTGVLTLSDDGHPFVSLKGLMGLMIDGMRQMGEKLAVAEERLRVAESRLAALPGGT